MRQSTWLTRLAQPASRVLGLVRRAFARPPATAAAERPWWDQHEPPWPKQFDHIPSVECVVNNRVFLLGLDELYRKAMKGHERGELLGCARRVAETLGVPPAQVPIEGYYAEHPDLTNYFRLMRALQQVELHRAAEVDALPAFQRLLAVTSSALYGRPVREYLLPVGRDPLSVALRTDVEWTVPALTAAAARLAREQDDCSLVGLAARAEDPVAIAALRESVVLYAEEVTGSALAIRPVFVWKVDRELAAAAQRFVDAFTALFAPELPPAAATYARHYWQAFTAATVIGRCVRLGHIPGPRTRYYHWAIVSGPDALGVREFWDDTVWTTQRFRSGAPASPS